MIVTSSIIPGFTTDMITPIAEQVIRKMIGELGLESFIGDNIYITSDYQASSKTKTDEGLSILQGNRIDCDVNYSMDPLRGKYETTTTKHILEYGNTLYEISNLETVFRDSSVKTIIQEHTIPCSLIFNGTISCIERTHATSIYTTFISTLGGTRPQLVNIFYSYPIPDPVTILTTYTYIKSGERDKGTTYNDYLKTCTNNKVGIVLNENLDKLRGTHVLNRTELEISVEVSMNDDKPQAVRTNKSVNHWTIGFTMSCQFNRPDTLLMVHPIIMNNELIDPMLLPFDLPTHETRYYVTRHPYIDIHDGMVALTEEIDALVKSRDDVYRQPFYDNFLIPSIHLNVFGYEPFFMAATPIDTTQLTTQIDLSSNLGSEAQPVHIKQPVLDILFNQGIRALTGQLPIALVVFADDVMIRPDTLTYINNTLTIPNRDLTKIYRLVIYENTKETDYVRSLRVLKVDFIPSR